MAQTSNIDWYNIESFKQQKIIQMKNTKETTGQNAWSGRFSEPTNSFVQAFTASVGFDKELAEYDIEGSRVHSRMLAEEGILSSEEDLVIQSGLDQIENEIQLGDFNWDTEGEDVHMNIEARLIDLIGDAGKKLHTGRSRNDQVATDLKLYLRAKIDKLLIELTQLQLSVVELAEKHAELIMPGFTHLQVAQPITFGHHLLAWFEMLERDYSRLSECRSRLNTCPLGSAALAGTSFPINRNTTSEALGFRAPTKNSLDSVSDRDFAIEFCFVASLVMTHLSRMCEELVLWTSAQFDFVEIPDRFCTGSSIMPQKKNPDVPELIRGKSGRTNGNLIALLTLMKSQPLAYNKDNQEDKEALFDSANTVTDCLKAFAELVPTLTPNAEKMRAAALQGFSTATDFADYLVRVGVPFRDAHESVSKAVSYCIKNGIDLADLSLDTLQGFHKLIDEDIYDVLTLEGSVQARKHLGGTAPEQVLRAVSEAYQGLSKRRLSND